MAPVTRRHSVVGLPVRSVPSPTPDHGELSRPAISKDSVAACAPGNRLLVSFPLHTVNVFVGGKMTRGEEAAVLALWSRWFQDKPRSNQSYVDFYFDVIQPHQLLGRINAFEILDVLVNTESVPEETQAQAQRQTSTQRQTPKQRQTQEDAESATEAV